MFHLYKYHHILILGVDDAPSECDLDDFNQWDLIISNNNSEESEEALNTVLDFLNKAI